MNTPRLKSRLELLHNQKVSIGQKAFSKGKYAINDLIMAINQASVLVEGLELPDDLEETKATAVFAISRTLKNISQEYEGMHLKPYGYDNISENMKRQVVELNYAIRDFDTKVLSWINQNNKVL
ncbi:hypothetical protein [Larkinella humicola]|uniref:Uncharacterized protein n=1 Tax=Larkinella humicola TaxID=2607654 RepID=A0A5N1JAN4_9BACT|nr:hypothetical protein [Larkinella humicola]KAA9349737.1 hypothetical protein F0P93_20000 [Larkinella humicola]